MPLFLAGLIYIPLNFHFVLTMQPVEIILVLGAATISDTAAFYAGTMWGKKKIWASCQPQKIMDWVACRTCRLYHRHNNVWNEFRLRPLVAMDTPRYSLKHRSPVRRFLRVCSKTDTRHQRFRCHSSRSWRPARPCGQPLVGNPHLWINRHVPPFLPIRSNETLVKSIFLSA